MHNVSGKVKAAGKSGVARKLGPRDYGHATNYTPAKFKLDDDPDFLKQKFIYKRSTAKLEVQEGQGPRDIGEHEYDAAEFKYDTKNDFLKDKYQYKLSTGKLEIKEGQGPRDIDGSHYNGTDYGYKQDLSGDFLGEKGLAKLST
eukprot:UN27709